MRSGEIFEPVKREGLSDQVYQSLRRRIIQGRIKPGEKLPAERDLARKFQVNRGAIREALSRLEENRLVSIKQGSGAIVQDWTRNFRLDFLADLLFVNGKINFQVFCSVLELRQILGPELAGYACQRASRQNIAELEKIARELAKNRDQPEKFQLLEYRFNQGLARASGNLAFEFMVNSIGSIYLAHAKIFRLGILPLLKSAGKYLEIVKAIKAGNEKKARNLIKQLFEKSGREFYHLIEAAQKPANKPVRKRNFKRRKGNPELNKK